MQNRGRPAPKRRPDQPYHIRVATDASVISSSAVSLSDISEVDSDILYNRIATLESETAKNRQQLLFDKEKRETLSRGDDLPSIHYIGTVSSPINIASPSSNTAVAGSYFTSIDEITFDEDDDIEVVNPGEKVDPTHLRHESKGKSSSQENSSPRNSESQLHSNSRIRDSYSPKTDELRTGGNRFNSAQLKMQSPTHQMTSFGSLDMLPADLLESDSDTDYDDSLEDTPELPDQEASKIIGSRSKSRESLKKDQVNMSSHINLSYQPQRRENAARLLEVSRPKAQYRRHVSKEIPPSRVEMIPFEKPRSPRSRPRTRRRLNSDLNTRRRINSTGSRISIASSQHSGVRMVHKAQNPAYPIQTGSVQIASNTPSGAVNKKKKRRKRKEGETKRTPERSASRSASQIRLQQVRQMEKDEEEKLRKQSLCENWGDMGSYGACGTQPCTIL